MILEPGAKILLVSLAAGTLFAYQLGDSVDVALVRFESRNGEHHLVCGDTICLNMAELPHQGHV